MSIQKTIAEINEKISQGTVTVVTADEMTRLVREVGPEEAAQRVDVVTTGTFGAMCSSGVWLNFGHSEPPIKMSRVWLNDVEAFTGVAAVDAYVGATQLSESRGMAYGGAHVIEDLLAGRRVVLRAVAYGTDCYPCKEIVSEITLDDLNFALMSNPRNGYQRYNAATNGGDRVLDTYMGRLLPHNGNVTFSGAGELSPLCNDPDYRTIGVGTRIFLGGAPGYVVGSGTQHSPESGFGTLMVQADLRRMSPEFLRAAVFHGYGCSMYIGLGIPIPVLDAEIARRTGVADADIETAVLDYSVPHRSRPVLRRVNYAELKSGSIELAGKTVPTSPLSSYHRAARVAAALKGWIERGEFRLSEAVEPLPRHGGPKPMAQRPPSGPAPVVEPLRAALWHAERCVSCGHCLTFCPQGVFVRRADWSIAAEVERCVQCGFCRDACPVGAVTPE